MAVDTSQRVSFLLLAVPAAGLFRVVVRSIAYFVCFSSVFMFFQIFREMGRVSALCVCIYFSVVGITVSPFFPTDCLSFLQSRAKNARRHSNNILAVKGKSLGFFTTTSRVRESRARITGCVVEVLGVVGT